MTALAGKRVLVVEDEPIVAMTAEDMLVDLGAKVVGPASTLREALRLAEAGGFDAALLDINLGGERSYQVAALLHARDVPFVFATGYGSAGANDHGAVDLIQKPYSEAKIASALVRVLAGH